jgi:hypothetical protein
MQSKTLTVSLGTVVQVKVLFRNQFCQPFLVQSNYAELFGAVTCAVLIVTGLKTLIIHPSWHWSWHQSWYAANYRGLLRNSPHHSRSTITEARRKQYHSGWSWNNIQSNISNNKQCHKNPVLLLQEQNTHSGIHSLSILNRMIKFMIMSWSFCRLWLSTSEGHSSSWWALLFCKSYVLRSHETSSLSYPPITILRPPNYHIGIPPESVRFHNNGWTDKEMSLESTFAHSFKSPDKQAVLNLVQPVFITITANW